MQGKEIRARIDFSPEVWAKLGEADKEYISDRTTEDGTVSLEDLVEIRQLVERLA